MQSDEFVTFPLEVKHRLIISHGHFIDDRADYGNASISLYSLYRFYVEIYHSVDEEKVLDIRIASEHQVLEWYIELRDVYRTHKGISPPVD